MEANRKYWKLFPFCKIWKKHGGVLVHLLSLHDKSVGMLNGLVYLLLFSEVEYYFDLDLRTWKCHLPARMCKFYKYHQSLSVSNFNICSQWRGTLIKWLEMLDYGAEDRDLSQFTTGKLCLSSSKCILILNQERTRQRKERDEFHLSYAVPVKLWVSNLLCLYDH